MSKRLVNELAYSLSRENVFRRCEREYWWAYFGSWGGWERGVSEECHLSYRVKKLENRYSLPGKIVHSAIERWASGILHDGSPVMAEILISDALDAMRQCYAASLRGEYLYSKAPGLVEHYLDLHTPREAWVAMGKSVSDGLARFLADHAPDIQARFAAIVQFEPFAKMEVEGVPTFAMPDLILHEESAATVIDWKLGRPRDEHVDQLLLYARFVSDRLGRPLESIHAEDRYLLHGGISRIEPSAPDMRARTALLVTRIRAFADTIRARMDGPETAPREAFPMTQDIASCASCRFRRVCKPTMQSATADDAAQNDDGLGE